MTLLRRVCVVVAAMVLTAACGAPPQTGNGTASAPHTISIVTVYEGSRRPTDDSHTIRRMEEYAGVDLDIEWVPARIYEDRMSVILTSGEAPMVITALDTTSPTVVDAVQSDRFWEIGPALRQFSRLRIMDRTLYRHTSIDGEIYGVVRARNRAPWGVVYRKDWLERLGLDEPRSIEELYETLAAFAAIDTDGDGGNDSYGITESVDPNGEILGFPIVTSYFGGFPSWGFYFGEIVPAHLTPAYRRAMEFYRRLYSEGILAPDFVYADRAIRRRNFDEGRAGLYFGALEDALHHDLDDSAGEVDVIGRLLSPLGYYRVPAAAGHSGIFMFPRATIENEGELERVLAFFERLCEPPMQELLRWGIDDGGPDDRRDSSLSEALEVRRQFRICYPETVRGDTPLSSLAEKIYRIQEENVQYLTESPTESLVSPTYRERGPDLTRIVNDARLQFILGEIDWDGWEAAIESWRENGGDEMVREYNAQYRAGR